MNNAGSSDNPQTIIQLHVVVLTRLTTAALPGMVERNHGAVINVASIAAFRTTENAGIPHMTIYAPTKAFDVAYCQRLYDELCGTGVQVQALCPGWTSTEMANRQEMAGIVPADAWLTVEDVVQASLMGLARCEVICVPGLDDAELLPELDRIKNAILAVAGTTAALAPRYREE